MNYSFLFSASLFLKKIWKIHLTCEKAMSIKIDFIFFYSWLINCLSTLANKIPFKSIWMDYSFADNQYLIWFWKIHLIGKKMFLFMTLPWLWVWNTRQLYWIESLFLCVFRFFPLFRFFFEFCHKNAFTFVKIFLFACMHMSLSLIKKREHLNFT